MDAKEGIDPPFGLNVNAGGLDDYFATLFVMSGMMANRMRSIA
jgi:hypothetical protein